MRSRNSIISGASIVMAHYGGYPLFSRGMFSGFLPENQSQQKAAGTDASRGRRFRYGGSERVKLIGNLRGTKLAAPGGQRAIIPRHPGVICLSIADDDISRRSCLPACATHFSGCGVAGQCARAERAAQFTEIVSS